MVEKTATQTPLLPRQQPAHRRKQVQPSASLRPSIGGADKSRTRCCHIRARENARKTRKNNMKF